MSTRPIALPQSSFLAAFAVQARVLGALIMRELHTRYGRENVGYLWLIGEPMLLASVIGLLHAANGHASSFTGDIRPVPFGVLGYCTFMVFRGIVNRSAGSMEANTPLLYHRQVTPLDVTVARALLEIAGVFLTFVVLMTFLVAIGVANPPVRPLAVVGAWALIFWYAFGHSLVITAVTYENRTIERLVHPYSYFMVGLSGSFFQVKWLPHPFREVLTYIPLTSGFELVRYGWFQSTNLDYFFPTYMIGACVLLTWMGLVLLRQIRHHIHLS